MNIVRWLLGHPLVAIWTLGAIAILLAMGSGNSNKHEVVDTAHATGNEVVNTAVSTTSHDAMTPKENEVVNTHKTTSSNEHVTPVVKQVNTEQNLSDDNTGLTMKGGSEPYVSNAVAEVKSNEPSSDKVEVVAEDLDQLDTEELLLMAREAYWNNGLDEAAQIYQQLIKIEPQVIEHKGELGNVYWRQGYPKKAAELYSEIAIPLIESGSSDRVTNMVGFIQLFYPDRVEVIMDRLERINNKK